jgi:hypothetical protein
VAVAGADGLAPRWLVHRALGRPAAVPRQRAERDPDHPRAAGTKGRRLHPRRTAPETGCGLYVEVLRPNRALVLRSNSHLPKSWRERDLAGLDWSWAFVLEPLDEGSRTRFHFRSRWWTRPWWLTLGGWLLIVPADHLMAHDMLRGVRTRAEETARTGLSALPSSAGVVEARQ